MAIFVGLQVLAVTFAAVGMHLPPPWAAATERDLAHRTSARIPRVYGYLSPDPRTDPYTPFYPGWHGRLCPRSSQAHRPGPEPVGRVPTLPAVFVVQVRLPRDG